MAEVVWITNSWASNTLVLLLKALQRALRGFSTERFQNRSSKREQRGHKDASGIFFLMQCVSKMFFSSRFYPYYATAPAWIFTLRFSVLPHRALPCLHSGVCSRIRTPTWQRPPLLPPLPPPRFIGTPFWTRCGRASGTAPTPSPWRYRTARCSQRPCHRWAAAAALAPSLNRMASSLPAPCLPSRWIPRQKWPATHPRCHLDPCPCLQKRARRRRPRTSCRASSAWSADWTPARTGRGAGRLKEQHENDQKDFQLHLGGQLHRFIKVEE